MTVTQNPSACRVCSISRNTITFKFIFCSWQRKTLKRTFSVTYTLQLIIWHGVLNWMLITEFMCLAKWFCINRFSTSFDVVVCMYANSNHFLYSFHVLLSYHSNVRRKCNKSYKRRFCASIHTCITFCQQKKCIYII